MSSIADSLTSPFNFLMSWLNLSFPRPIDQKLFQTMTKLTEGISARDVFREAETLCAQGADPNTVGTDVDTGKSVHMLAGLLYGPSDWLNCSMVRLAEFLVSHGFDPRVDNGRNGAQALAYACYLNALNDGLMNGLKYLLKVGADPTCPFGVIGNEGADCFADPYSNGISHGGQKTPLNTAYLSILESKYEAFELWQPSRTWAVYRLLMSALRKDNNIDNVQLPVHCLGQSVVQLYALSNCHLVPSRCGECGVEFEVSRNPDGLERKQQAEIDFLKKSSSVLCQAAQVKYAFLKTCLDSKLIGRRKLISVRKAATLLRISTSGYYQWLKVDRYHRHGVHHSDAELLCHVRSVISRCGKQVPGVMRL